jgi:hypothetical protein
MSFGIFDYIHRFTTPKFQQRPWLSIITTDFAYAGREAAIYWTIHEFSFDRRLYEMGIMAIPSESQ